MAQMGITCQGVSARMMELLYGELPRDDRAAVEAHLAACASCRAELAGFETTRVAARRALDADEPPARAHQAILRAAAAAVAAKQPQPIEALPFPTPPSFWQRLRMRWTFPTFATVSAVAVVVLASKVFLEPDKTVELGRQALRSAPAEAPGPPPAPIAAQPEAQEAGKTAPPAEAAKARRDAESWRLQHPAEDKAPARSSVAPAAQAHHGAAAGPLGSLDGLAKGSRRGGRGEAAQANDALDSLMGDGDIAGSRQATPAARPSKREFAPPPPPRAETASPPAAGSLRATGPVRATGSFRMKDRQAEDEILEGTAPIGGSGGRPAGGAAAAPPAARAAKAKKASAPAGADLDGAPAASSSASAPAPAPPAAAAPGRANEERRANAKMDTESDTKNEAPPGAESPVARADRLFAEGHWAAAARAYRELLRHDPKNADAARWRQRLAASQDAASARAPAAASPER